mmetsp:Transcript_20561/g.41162  ORF Transcript_20561/g.41162 Transcript_20561/m.41162 type:complete len:137 (-) Transcript_20561:28-438(-)
MPTHVRRVRPWSAGAAAGASSPSAAATRRTEGAGWRVDPGGTNSGVVAPFLRGTRSNVRSAAHAIDRRKKRTDTDPHRSDDGVVRTPRTTVVSPASSPDNITERTMALRAILSIFYWVDSAPSSGFPRKYQRLPPW